MERKRTINGQEMTEIRPLIAIPPFRQGVTHSQILFDLMAIARRGYDVIRMVNMRTEIARNNIAQTLLDNPEATHVLMLDADQRHPTDIVERLCMRIADDPKKQVISAAYYRRGAPHEPLAFTRDAEGRMFQVTFTGSSIQKVDCLGTGCLLIAREVFEQLEWPWFKYEYFEDAAGGRHYPSEDVYFSKKCREAGIDLWLDTGIECPHHGDAWITGKDWAKSLENSPWEVVYNETGLMTTPGSVLYVGARPEGSPLLEYLLTAGHIVDVLEAYRPNCEAMCKDDRIRNVIQGDVREPQNMGDYDWAIWWHGPEHVTVQEFPLALAQLNLAAIHTLIGCPWGEYPQGELYGNPYEKHVTAWQPQDFEKLGFTVRTTHTENDPSSNIIAWR